MQMLLMVFFGSIERGNGENFRDNWVMPLVAVAQIFFRECGGVFLREGVIKNY